MVKMRFLLAVALLPALAAAAILPDAIGANPRASSLKVANRAADQPIWDELGLKDSETVQYVYTPAPFTVTAFQLADSTAALAAFEWQRPAASKPSKAALLAAETPGSLLLVHGNYLLRFDGYKPSKSELEAVFGTLQTSTAPLSPTSTSPTRDWYPTASDTSPGRPVCRNSCPESRPTPQAFNWARRPSRQFSTAPRAM